jgi:hypothetical protein
MNKCLSLLSFGTNMGKNCEGNKRTDIFSKLVYLFLCRMRMGKGAELIKMLSNN